MKLDDKLTSPYMLIELLKYQEYIINAYKKYIEENIHKSIKENVIEKPLLNIDGWGHFKKISIPQSEFIVSCNEDILNDWEILKHELPPVDWKFILTLTDMQKEELKNRCQN